MACGSKKTAFLRRLVCASFGRNIRRRYFLRVLSRDSGGRGAVGVQGGGWNVAAVWLGSETLGDGTQAFRRDGSATVWYATRSVFFSRSGLHVLLVWAQRRFDTYHLHKIVCFMASTLFHVHRVF